MAGMAIHGWEESEVLPFCIVVMRSHFDTMIALRSVSRPTLHSSTIVRSAGRHTKPSLLTIWSTGPMPIPQYLPDSSLSGIGPFSR
jgi:hypothetical protein